MLSSPGDCVRRIWSRRDTPWGVERLEVCPGILVASHPSRTFGHRRPASRAGAGLLLNDMGKRVFETRRRGTIERASDLQVGQPSYLLASALVVLRDRLRCGLRFHDTVVVAYPSPISAARLVSVRFREFGKNKDLMAFKRPRRGWSAYRALWRGADRGGKHHHAGVPDASCSGCPKSRDRQAAIYGCRRIQVGSPEG